MNDRGTPTDADILRDLARAKAVFQLHAIEAIIRGPRRLTTTTKGPCNG